MGDVVLVKSQDGMGSQNGSFMGPTGMVSTSQPGSEGAMSERSAVYALVIGCILATLLLLLVFTLAFVLIQDRDMKDEGRSLGDMVVPSGSSGGSGDGLPIPVNTPGPPAAIPLATPHPATHPPGALTPAPPVGPITGVHTPPPHTGVPPASPPPPPAPSSVPRPPLLCSVSFIAGVSTVYPPDKACDILVYTHVYVEGGKVLSVDSEGSFGTFKNVCSLYTESTCGLSFDVRYLSADMFAGTEVRDELAGLRQRSRVNHYGILNIYGHRNDVRRLAVDAGAAFKGFRNLLGDDRINHKIMFAVGYYSYETDAWDQLRYIAENTASAEVDIVVIITTVLNVPSRNECITMPSNAMRSSKVFTPNLHSALPMARNSFGRGSLTVAFALEMGVVTYVLKQIPGTPLDALYKECLSISLSDYSQACQLPPTLLQSEKIAIGISGPDTLPLFNKTVLHLYDTLDFMKEKAEYVMTTMDRRQNFTWFLLNVHLTDVTQRCLTQGPFERLTGFRDFYLNEWQKSSNG